jgi:deazaflavin-dependent oxidoreductase (nitroreductase family)
LVLTQGTDAPWDGRVELVVDEVYGAERDVPLHLRIPGWCASVHASVNSELVRAAATPGSYLRIERRWQRGDRVELALAMEPELLVGHPRLAEARGAVAVRRGPLVYCAEEVDQPGVDVLAAGVRIDRPVVAERRDDMLGGVVTLRASGVAPEPEPALYRPLARGSSGRAAAGNSVGRPFDLVLVPYWAWANRGLGAMAVWLRRDADAMATSGRVPPARPRRASRFARLSRNALVRLPKPMIKTFSTMHRVAVSASGGRVGMRFRGEPLILLTTTGRKTGKDRTWPLVGLPVESGGWVIAGSNGGHDAHPAWYLNLQVNPAAMVQEGRRHVKVLARDASPAERAEHWSRFVDLLDTYAEYQAATDRQIPVVMLEPVS